MANLAALRTKLQNRLGLGAVGTVESSRLDEAINAGILRAASDGIPGLLRDVFIAHSYADLSATIGGSGHTVDTSLVTLTATLDSKNVYPQDIFKAASATFLIKRRTAAAIVDIGAIYGTSLNGESVTIVRRSIGLPTTGQVVAVRQVDGSKLEPHAQNAAYVPTEEGTPSHFEQRYDAQTNTSHLVLYPAPSSSEAYSIIQSQGLAELGGGDLDMPDAAIDAVLERALRAYRAWDGGTTPTQLSATENAVIDTSDQLKNTSNAKQGYVRQ